MLDYNELFEPIDEEDPAQVDVPAVSIAERAHQEHHILFWQVRGGSSFTVDGESVRLLAGQAMWVPAGVKHEFRVGERSVLLPIFFELEDGVAPLEDVTVIRVNRSLHALMLPFMQWQSSILRPTDHGGAQILQYLGQSPAIVKNPVAADPQDNDSKASGEDEVSVTDDACITFGQWRMRNRIETAALLLQRSSRIAAVANSVGYLDVNSFGRSSENHFGVSPDEYAQYYAEQRGA